MEQKRAIQALGDKHLVPLWNVMGDLVTREPATPALPYRWRYTEVRDALFQAGKMISAEQAERRVLILENPAMVAQSAITRSLYAGVQLVLPGEVAPAHRHSQAALRFVIEADGAFTTVEGERLPMFPGDLILTPSWTWHDHGNETQIAAVWLDGLDVQIVNLLDTSFAEPGNDRQQMITAAPASLRYANGLAPVNPAPGSTCLPTVRFPYRTARDAVVGLAGAGMIDPHHGARLRYVDQRHGSWALPTMGPVISFLPAGFKTLPYRSTDAGIFLVQEGRGTVTIAGTCLPLDRYDVFVVPSWASRSFEADADLVLQSFSDRPTQEALGLFREQL